MYEGKILQSFALLTPLYLTKYTYNTLLFICKFSEKIAIVKKISFDTNKFNITNKGGIISFHPLFNTKKGLIKWQYSFLLSME